MQDKKFSNVIKLFFSFILFFSVVACNNKLDTSSLTIVNEKTITQGISMDLVELDKNQICIKYINKTENDWIYGDNYSLHIYIDNNWYYVPYKKTETINDIGYILKAGEEVIKTYSLSKFQNLGKGKYRFENNGVYVEFNVN